MQAELGLQVDDYLSLTKQYVANNEHFLATSTCFRALHHYPNHPDVLRALHSLEPQLSPIFTSLPTPTRKKRILCLDGGGVRGIIEIIVLRAIETLTGKKIYELFDMICGTSTGGIIALSLGIEKQTLDFCKELYLLRCKKVFGSKKKLPIPSFHDSTLLVEELKKEDTFGNRKCKDFPPNKEKHIPHVFVVSTNVNKSPPIPYLFRNYINNDSVFVGDNEHYIWQAARATSAAPVFFDTYVEDGLYPIPNLRNSSSQLQYSELNDKLEINHKENATSETKKKKEFGIDNAVIFSNGNLSSSIQSTSQPISKENRKGKMFFVDGGILANNPTLIAFAECKSLGWDEDQIEMILSIGTGLQPSSTVYSCLIPQVTGKTGFWGQLMDTGLAASRHLELIKLLMDSATNSESVSSTVRGILPKQIKYFRLNPKVNEIQMDSVDNLAIAEMMERTKIYLETDEVKHTLDEIVNILLK